MNPTHADNWTPVQRTLAIPLAGRAVARERFADLHFEDAAAERAFRSIPRELREPLLRDRASLWGSIRRTQLFDRLVLEFLASHPDAAILTLGAGFCTRPERLRSRAPRARWIEVDFPEIIGAKGDLFHADRGVTPIGGDLVDPETVADALIAAPAGPVLVIAEGVLMFLEEERRNELLRRLACALPDGSAIAFDFIHPWIRALSRRHPSLGPTGASYRSGFRRLAAQVRKLAPRLSVRSSRLFTSEYRGMLRAIDRLTRVATLGAPLYDVAVLDVGGRE